MKKIFLACSFIYLGTSCNSEKESKPIKQHEIIGTWRLLTGVTVENKDTTLVDYTKGQELIKIITPTHFSFLRHDLNNGKDSTATFVAGGGKAKITSDKYTEYLTFCNYRDWEGGTFEFDYSIKNDTLIIKGIEKIEKLGVNHLNIETYIKEK